MKRLWSLVSEAALQHTTRLSPQMMMIMVSTVIPIKFSKNGLILCQLCINFKGRSKRFSSTRALKWHVTHHHDNSVGELI